MQKADQRAKERAAGQEGAGAVNRIQHPEIFGIAPLRAVFLAHDAMGGEALGEEGPQGPLSRPIGFGDGRGIALCLDQKGRAEERADDAARQIGRRFRGLDEFGADQGNAAEVVARVRK